MTVVDAQHLGKQYPNGVEALVDVSLTIDAGQLVAILGPSGSGKTTLFRLCNGSVRPTAGHLSVLGQGIARLGGADLRRLRRRIAIVYQNHNLVGTMSVLQNVLVGRLGREGLLSAVRSALVTLSSDRNAVMEILEPLGLADKAYSRVDDLSGGQQQRVAIARALMQRPELLLADEPVASVDGDTATAILDLLATRCHEDGTTVLISLHQRQYVERYADRVIELRRGNLVRDDLVTREAPRERVTVS